MADYTVIVDDTNGQIIYGPNEDSWSSVNSSDHAYRGTLHNALSQDATLTFNFFGDRELVIRGNFEGDNNASDNATYPIFQIDAENFNCSPNPPQNGGQFLCSTVLSSKIANHSLSMFVNPNAATQKFHIDYIRYGSSSQAAQVASGTVLNVLSPDKSTPGLTFDSNWEISKSLGDVESAMLTSTPLSTATYHFVGDSFAWWGCCMPTGTSSNAAYVTFSIDGGDIIPIQIDGQFLQGPQCLNENILFQTQPGQLDTGNHTLEVVYNGDDTRMPMTLCSLAAAPVDFSILDVQALSSNHQTYFPSSTLSHSTTPSHAPFGGTVKSHPGEISNPRSTTGIIAGIISGVAVAVIIIVVGVIWCRRMRAKRRAEEKRSSSLDSLLPFVFHPVVGFIDMDKRASTAVPTCAFSSSSSSLPTPAIVPNDMPAAPPVRHEQGEHNTPRRSEIPSNSSPLGSRPPSYRTTGSLLNS